MVWSNLAAAKAGARLFGEAERLLSEALGLSPRTPELYEQRAGVLRSFAGRLFETMSDHASAVFLREVEQAEREGGGSGGEADATTGGARIARTDDSIRDRVFAGREEWDEFVEEVARRTRANQAILCGEKKGVGDREPGGGEQGGGRGRRIQGR